MAKLRKSKSQNKPTSKPDNWKESVEYAGFYVRMAAMGLDTLVILLPLSLLFAAIYALAWGGANFSDADLLLLQQAQGDAQQMQEVVIPLLAKRLERWLLENLIFSLASGAVIIAAWYYFSATPGKMIMKIKLVDADTGRPPSAKQDIIRYAGYFVSTIVLTLGMIWIAFDPRKQGWHDKMANTVVVYKKSLPPELAELTHRTQMQQKDA